MAANDKVSAAYMTSPHEASRVGPHLRPRRCRQRKRSNPKNSVIRVIGSP
jgi:hypothetical protein